MDEHQSFATFQPRFSSSPLDLNVYYAGQQVCRRKYAWGPVFRDHYLLHLVLRGKGRFEMDYHTWDLSAGQAFLIRPQVRARYEADAVVPWAYAWVGFNGTAAAGLLARVGLTPGSPVCGGVPVRNVRAPLTRIRAWLKKGEPGILGATGAFLELLGSMGDASSAAATVRSETGGRTALYLRSATEFMEKNLSCPIRITDVAKYVGIDRTHLSRLFKQNLNTSPEQVLIRMRMKAAAVLLVRPDVRVKEVACSVGYHDPLYFSRMFRQVYGLSPENHRRRTLGEPGRLVILTGQTHLISDTFSGLAPFSCA
jgi:AraC family transcriptional regulator of arabinose operon